MSVSRARLGGAITVAVAATLAAASWRGERLAGVDERPVRRIEVRIPDEARAAGVDPLAAVWRRRVAPHALTVRTGDGAAVIVEVAGVPERTAAGLVDALTVPGELSMRAVESGTDTARRWYERVEDGELSLAVTAANDIWTVEDGGPPFLDNYLAADTPELLAEAVAALGQADPVPDHLEVLVERAEVQDDGAPYWRTYLVARDPIVDNRDVVGAEPSTDQYSGEAQVSVRFTPEAGRRFADATAQMIGHKLAIVVDGEIAMAPIVQSEIRGGSVMIGLGRDTPAARRDAMARTLAMALTGGALPPGLTARALPPRRTSAATVWLVRVGVGLLAGLLVWLLAGLVARRGWLEATAATVPGGRRRWTAMAVPALITVGLPALLIVAARHLPLPGLTAELANVLAMDPVGAERVSVLAVGVTPVVSGFVAAELVAALLGLAMPAWHRRRLGTPADRRWIDLAAWLLVIGLAGLQAWTIVEFLSGAPGLVDQPTVAILSLMAGVMVHVVAAELIGRHGLGNGYLILYAAWTLTRWWRLPSHVDLGGDSYDLRLRVVALALAVAAVSVVVASLRAPPDRRRLPWAGAVPAAMIGVAATGMALLVPAWPALGEPLFELTGRSVWYDLAVAVVLTGLIAALAPSWGAGRRGEAPPPRAVAGWVVSFGFVLALVGAPLVIDAPFRAGLVVDAVVVGLAVAELVAAAVARAALTGAVTIAAVHDVDRADRISAALTAAGIDHAVEGVRARAVLRLFGSLVPIVIRVAPARATEAAALVDGVAAGDADADAGAGAKPTPADGDAPAPADRPAPADADA